MSDEQPPEGGPAAFFFMLLGREAERRKKLDQAMDKFSAPAVNVRLPMLLIVRLVDGVACQCDMCIGTLMWAKSIDKRQLDDELRRVLEMAILNAEMRLMSEKQKEEYSRLYGHKA